MAIIVLAGKNIIKDDTYTLTLGNGNSRTLAVSGSFGGGTLSPGYMNAENNFIGFKDDTETLITFTADFQIVQDGGIGMKYALDVSGSTTPDILVEQFEHGR